jgi:hypothetical protein
MLIAVLTFLPLLTGCTVADALFGVFGSYYTDGGDARADRKSHYDQQVQASQHYQPWDR